MRTMKLDVEIISEENIKPSSPTPQALKHFKFSVLDQLIPANYTYILLWYQPSTISEIPNMINSLKKSLSNTLTHYYPLAGTMKDDFSIDCNDQGARFIETRVSCTTKEFLKTPDVMLLNSFLPCDILKKPIPGTHVSSFQVNVFKCGGISIGICVAHKIFDGSSLSIFLRSWTAAARGCGEIVHPTFYAYNSEVFAPATKLLSTPPKIMSLLKKGHGVTKRFVFDGTAVAALKSQAVGDSGRKIPSRVQVVTALLWKSLMSASTAKDGIKKPSTLTHLVNFRSIAPPHGAADNSIGNMLLKAAAYHEPDSKSDIPDLVGELRKGFSEINGEFVKKMVQNSSISETVKEHMLVGTTRDDIDYFRFTSWCNFGLPKADFGWGKPIWASSVGLEGVMFVNLIILVDTAAGDGVDAWVTVDEEEMAILERNKELLNFASVDPSPLGYGLMSTYWD